ncbi:MAG TPA: MBL fold hydrolase [Desulfotomaculum sp.]|nr:MBL fold hydrolase [Desulfotomaculum sp.]
MEKTILQQITERPMTTQQVTPDIFLLQFPLVNAFMVGDPNNQNKEWVLIGAGMAHTSKDIFQAAEGRFGQGSQPKAIILTHGHFDHVGAITELTNTWNVPVYAHAYELPYLTGQMDYPPADPSVDKGLIARISPTFPHKGINLGTRAAPLPADGSVPWMPGWQWIHTPGHSPGHVSLFRDSDRVLIVGDAFTTLKQESATSVLTREKEVHGPPAYFTTDWQAAEQSVQVLNELNPSLVIPSHGLPMGGEELKQQLSELAHNFVHLAVPEQGQYVGQPAPNS